MSMLTVKIWPSDCNAHDRMHDSQMALTRSSKFYARYPDIHVEERERSTRRVPCTAEMLPYMLVEYP